MIRETVLGAICGGSNWESRSAGRKGRGVIKPVCGIGWGKRTRGKRKWHGSTEKADDKFLLADLNRRRKDGCFT